MELKKQSENLNRAYDLEGNVTERIDSVQYDILNNEGNVIGNANVYSGGLNASFNLSGFSTIEDGERQLAEIFSKLKE